MALAGLCFLCSCGDPKPKLQSDSPTRSRAQGELAQVGNTVITEEMFRAEWAHRHKNGGASGEPSEKERLEVLEALVSQEAIWAKARAEGFDRSPEMLARIKSLVVGAYRESHAKSPSSEISEVDLQAQYEIQKARLLRPAAVRAAAILLAVPRSASAAKRMEIKAKAENIAQLAFHADDAGFADLARQHSEDQATRFRGGELGWLTRDSVGRDTKLFDALTALPAPGGLSNVVETSIGFQVGRLLQKRGPGPRPFAEVREQLRHQVQAARRTQAQEDFQQSLKRGLAIEVDHNRLAAMNLIATPSAPPSLPGGVSPTATP